VNRLFSADKADYIYSTDRYLDDLLKVATYKDVTTIGGMPLVKEDMPGCSSLTPIYGLTNEDCSLHVLLTSVDAVHQWTSNLGFTNEGIFGYAVLKQGDCGATQHVRLLHSPLQADCSKNTYLQATNDTEYSDFQQKKGYAVDQTYSPSGDFYIWPAPIELPSLIRVYSADRADFIYTVDKYQVQLLGEVGYKVDGGLGRLPMMKEDMPNCASLTPIYLITNVPCSLHALVTSMDAVHQWVSQLGWTEEGILGFGVLKQGDCGATRHVQLVHTTPLNSDCSKNTYFQTSNATEYSSYQGKGYAVDPTYSPQGDFYIWE